MSELTMWTVYDHPADYPNCYVARAWLVMQGGEPIPTTDVIISADLEKLRDVLLDNGLACVTRSPDDDPNIVESWL